MFDLLHNIKFTVLIPRILPYPLDSNFYMLSLRELGVRFEDRSKGTLTSDGSNCESKLKSDPRKLLLHGRDACEVLGEGRWVHLAVGVGRASRRGLTSSHPKPTDREIALNYYFNGLIDWPIRLTVQESTQFSQSVRHSGI